mmetsp:Transcript_19200/g.39675  ORF Transcript_19200/g.39675 Transcript_19200/m.39675 type:complete len:220 (-) Transcript_19200:194-853(-)
MTGRARAHRRSSVAPRTCWSVSVRVSQPTLGFVLTFKPRKLLNMSLSLASWKEHGRENSLPLRLVSANSWQNALPKATSTSSSKWIDKITRIRSSLGTMQQVSCCRTCKTTGAGGCPMASLRACWAFCGAAAAALSPVATASRNQRKGATKGPTNSQILVVATCCTQRLARSWFSAKASVFRTTSSSEAETGAKRSGRPAQTCSKSSLDPCSRTLAKNS